MSGAVTDKIPRRARIDKMTPAEQAIRAAVDAVEEMPADVRLTRAVMLLQEARELVADFVDGVSDPSPRVMTEFRRSRTRDARSFWAFVDRVTARVAASSHQKPKEGRSSGTGRGVRRTNR